MRLGSKRRICFRTNRVNKKKVSGFLCFIFAIVALLAGALYFLKSVRPVMAELAKSKAQYLAIDMIESAVAEIFREDPISYSDIVTLEKDSDGKIRALQSNLSSVNRLKADISLGIQQKIAELSETELLIPAGSLSGYDFFAGVGPRIRVTLLPYGDTRAEFESSFESAGINQTRLVVNLKVKTSLGLLMPTVNTTCAIESTVPVLQTIIVGEIPDSYLNVDREGGTPAEDALELAPSP